MPNMAHQVTNPPIFVVGPPRCGTTLVARILNNHSRVFIPGETDFFDDIYSRREKLGDPKNPLVRKQIIERLSTLYERYNHPADQQRITQLFSDPTILEEIMQKGQSYSDIFRVFMEIQMRSKGKRYWGNQVPKDIFSMDTIVSFFSNARIVVCIRDVRDFLSSYKNLWKVGRSKMHSMRIKELYHPILTSLLWKASAKQVGRLPISRDNCLVVHYEELVQEPRTVIERVCNVVGIPFEEEMLQLDSHNSSRDARGRGIFSSSVGRWRQDLKDEEVYLAQRIARKELEQFGYEREVVTVSPIKLAYLIASCPFAVWGALRANRDLRGPLLPYLFRRMASLLS